MKGIPKSDREYIKQLQQEMKPVADVLSKLISGMTKHKGIIMESYFPYDHSAWSIVRQTREPIEEIDNQLFKLNIAFITAIELHFKTKYNIYFKNYEMSTRGKKLLKLQPLISPEIVVNNMLNQIKDLNEVAIATLRRNLKSMRCDRSATRMLTFNRVYYNGSFGYSHVVNIGKDNVHLNAIMKALSLQEYGDMETDRYGVQSNCLDITRPYEFDNSEVLEKMRFYKNGKCVVTFKTPELKDNFIKLHEL